MHLRSPFMLLVLSLALPEVFAANAADPAASGTARSAYLRDSRGIVVRGGSGEIGRASCRERV